MGFFGDVWKGIKRIGVALLVNWITKLFVPKKPKHRGPSGKLIPGAPRLTSIHQPIRPIPAPVPPKPPPQGTPKRYLGADPFQVNSKHTFFDVGSNGLGLNGVYKKTPGNGLSIEIPEEYSREYLGTAFNAYKHKSLYNGILDDLYRNNNHVYSKTKGKTPADDYLNRDDD